MRYHANTAAKRNSNYDVSLDEFQDCIASRRTISTELDEKELIKVIEDFLEKLSVENRVTFMRRYWFSDSYAEIAELIGISEKNISVRLTRIRKQLRNHLKEIVLKYERYRIFKCTWKGR